MMTYDGLVLAAVASELKRTLIGGHIQQIRQHNDTDITLEIRSGGRSHLLFMSVHPRFSRVYTTAASLPVPASAPGFCMLLRKHLRGSYVKSVEQIGFDRVLHIRTEASDGNRNTLVLELMGKHSNLILITDTGRILGAAKNITAAVSRYRQVLPGLTYEPPPGSNKANPITLDREAFDMLWEEGLGKEHSKDNVKRWLVAVLSGTGPFLAEEIILRAGETDPDAVWAAIQDIKSIVTNDDYVPVLITDDRGAAVYAYPIPVGQYPSAVQHERRSMNETLDTVYRDLIRRDEFDSEYRSIETAIRRSIARREEILRGLDEALAEGEKAERYKQFGELILASVGGIIKGDTIARVVDYYDPQMSEVEIPLDEKLSPHENAERYFKRYRKAVDGAGAAIDRQKELRTEIKILRSALDKLPEASSVDALKALRAMLTQKELLRPEALPAAFARKQEPEFGGAKIRRVMSSDDLEILYGENSISNDYLTTKVARPNDLWLHARSVTGAHVVVKTGNRPDAVPKRTIMEAAEIAARNSDAKHSRLVPVDYTLRKHVRKPRGTAPGFVTYSRERTLDVTLQPR